MEPGLKPSLSRRLAAEGIGTFVLTLVAAGADIVDARTGGGVGHVARYLAPGLLVTALIFSLSGISGAHINPAVTIAFVSRRSFPIVRAVFYIIAQLAGALVAGLVLFASFGPAAQAGVPQLGSGVTPTAGIFGEAVITAILVLVILGTSEEQAVVGKNAAIAVGFTVAAMGLTSSFLTGASMNPARSLGPALATGNLENWYVDVAGPILGAFVSAGIVQCIYGAPNQGEREAARGKDT
ncbi:MAG: aquaporin [Candidatus Velthaea sp.]